MNLGRLSDRFEAGAVVDHAALVGAGLARPTDRVKVLGTGELAHKLSLKVHAISASARQKIEAKGASVEIVGAPAAPANG